MLHFVFVCDILFLLQRSHERSATMAKVRVCIEETISKEFEIEVPDGKDPTDVAIEKYKSGELVLDPGEPQFRQVCVLSPDPTEWVEF